MKAKAGVLERLNRVLTAELTAIHQYLLHAEMCGNWGYERLHHAVRERALEEVAHVQDVIHHILYLEGAPEMQRLEPINVGATVPDQLRSDLRLEQADLALLREAIAHCTTAGDYPTRQMLEEMAVETEEHIDWMETQLETIKQTGLENYLAEQIKKENS
jgi:bacterioferritin